VDTDEAGQILDSGIDLDVGGHELCEAVALFLVVFDEFSNLLAVEFGLFLHVLELGVLAGRLPVADVFNCIDDIFE
jgi:hypothetical protein